MSEQRVHYWHPPTGGALHAFYRPTEAVFTDNPTEVNCEVCQSNMTPTRSGPNAGATQKGET